MGDVRDSHEDHGDKFFRDETFLAAYGGVLNQDNIMEYFSNSVFCDKRFLNDGTLEYRQIPTGHEPHLFIIRKLAPSVTGPQAGRGEETLAEYYVLQGTIYQAPDLHALCTSRVQNCAHFLKKATEELMAHVRFTPSEGRTWDFLQDAAPAPTPPSGTVTDETGSDNEGDGDVHRRVVVDEGASDHMLRLLHQDFVQQAAARRKTKKRRRPKPSDTHDTGVKHSRKS